MNYRGPAEVLASFNIADGRSPRAVVIVSGDHLYGMTFEGGANNLGTIYSVPLAGGPITTLVSFDGTNGAKPFGDLLLVGNTLYGSTSEGGANGLDTVISITVPEPGSAALLIAILAIPRRQFRA